MLLNSLLSGFTWYPFLFDSPMNIARGIAFWLTVALAIVFTVCALALKGEKREKFLKDFLFGAVIYACAMALFFLIFTFMEDGIVIMLFVPLLVLVAAIGISAAVIFFRRSKTAIIVCACICGAAVVAVLVCMGVYYAQNIAEDGYFNSETASVYPVALYLSVVILIAAVAALAFLFGKKDKKGFDSKSISYAAICIAMSFALSYVRFFKLPQGGSVTLASLVPLMVYSYMFGTKKGVFAGFIYGLLQAIQDPWIIHPAQFLLDYPIAFACIGLAGMFAKVKKLEKLPQLQFALGAIVASVFRFVSHVLSGVFAFEVYAGELNPWAYSIAYNSFVFVDIAIAIVVGVIIFSSPSFVKQARKFNNPKSASKEETNGDNAAEENA